MLPHGYGVRFQNKATLCRDFVISPHCASLVFSGAASGNYKGVRMIRHMRQAERWLLRCLILFAALVATSLPALAGVAITGASPSNFSRPGQTITFTFVLSGENAIVEDIRLVNMNKPLSGLSCSPGFPVDVFGTTTCTATYTTTASDVTDILEYGGYELTTNGGPRSGSIEGRATVTYVPDVDPAPTVNSVVVPSDSTYGYPGYLTFIVNFDKDIFVTGRPSLELNVGGSTRSATFTAAPPRSITFTYFLLPDDLDLDGISIVGINLNGGAIKNAAGTAADLTLHNVPSTAGVKIDAVAPEILSSQVVNNPPSNASNVTFQLVFSEPVTGFTASNITLTASGTASATLSGLSTSDNKTYTVQATGISGAGTLRADVMAGAAQDVGGNGNPAFTGGTPWVVAPSSNADLSNLIPGEGTLEPPFASGTLSYDMTVANSVSTITFTPTATDPTATIRVNGVAVSSGSTSSAITLPVGTTAVAIEVTAQDGTTKKSYTVTVTREASAVNNLASLVPSVGSLSPAFDAATLAYDLAVENDVDSVSFTPIVAEASATITVNGTAVASGSQSQPITLVIGSTPVNVVITAQDGKTKKTYTVTVTRAGASNAALGSLMPSEGTLSPAFSATTLSYSVSVENAIDSIQITPTVADARASVTVNGAAVASGSASGDISLAIGTTQISVVVTAQDGTTKLTYQVSVVRAAFATADLSSLVPNVGSLDPAFGVSIYSYSLSVANTVESIAFTPTTLDAAATISINGSAVASGATSGSISLAVGTTDVSIIVTAQDGTTTKTYSVSVIRPKPLPTAASRTIELTAGTSATVDLTEGATGSPFTTAALTSVPGSDAGTAHLDAQTQLLTFDASPTFAGSAGVAYTLTNAAGTSAPATITFAVVARPDPSKDPEVLGLLRAQTDAAKRFAQYQTRNFNNRLEQLHDEGDRRRNSMDIRLGYRESDSNNDDSRTDAERRLEQMGDTGMPGLLGYTDDNDAPRDPGNPSHGSGIQRPDFGPYAVWAGGFVDFAERDKGGLDIDSTAVGVSAGIDYRFSPKFVAGVGVGYGHDKSDVRDNGTESRAHAYSAAIYGSYKPVDHLFIDGLIGGSWLDYDSHRYVTANGDFADGERTGKQVFGSLTAAYEFRDPKWLVSPYGRVEFSRSWLDGFTEKGGGIFGLTYGDQTVDTLSGVLGIRASYDIFMDWGKLTPGVRAEFTHDFAGSSRISLGYTDVDTMPYAVDIDAVGNDYAILGLSLDAAFLNDWMLGLEYRNAFGSGRQDHAVGLKISAKF
jgi:uncharacterized protein with beta-barrel porin domain